MCNFADAAQPARVGMGEFPKKHVKFGAAQIQRFASDIIGLDDAEKSKLWWQPADLEFFWMRANIEDDMEINGDGGWVVVEEHSLPCADVWKEDVASEVFHREFVSSSWWKFLRDVSLVSYVTTSSWSQV